MECRAFEREHLFEEDFPMADAPDFVVHFSIVPEPRIGPAKKHRRIDILFIAVWTIICAGRRLYTR